MCKKTNWFYLILFVFTVAGSYALAAVMYGLGIELPLWFQMIQTYLVMAVPTVIFMLIVKINPAKNLPFRVLKPADALLSILFGYMLVPMMIFLNFVTMLFVQNHLQDTSSNLFYQYPFIVQLILMAVIPGIVEEFIFRGVIYHSYRKNGVLGAAVLSALCFGLFHMNFNQFFYAFVLGLVFALLVEATSSLFSSMLAHIAANSYSVIMINLIPSNMLESDSTDAVIEELSQAQMLIGNIMAAVMLAMFAFGFGAVAYVIYKKLAKRNNRSMYMRVKLSQKFRAVNGERFVTVPAVIAIVLGVAVMVLMQ